MTKTDLVDAVASTAEITKTAAAKAVDALTGAVAGALKRGTR